MELCLAAWGPGQFVRLGVGCDLEALSVHLVGRLRCQAGQGQGPGRGGFHRAGRTVGGGGGGRPGGRAAEVGGAGAQTLARQPVGDGEILRRALGLEPGDSGELTHRLMGPPEAQHAELGITAVASERVSPFDVLPAGRFGGTGGLLDAERHQVVGGRAGPEF